MAYSDNQVQLRKHGDAVLGSDDEASGAVRSISLWSDVNLRAADFGDRVADRIVGLAYGYRGAPGQWWYSEVRRGVPPGRRSSSSPTSSS